MSDGAPAPTTGDDGSLFNRGLILGRECIRHVCAVVQDYLSPRHCAVCRRLLPDIPRPSLSVADSPRLFNRFTCSDCDPLHPHFHHLLLPGLGRRFSDREAIVVESTCDCCGEISYSVASAAGLCAACALNPPPYRRIFSVCSYQGPIEALIRAYKYDCQKGLAEPLAMLLYASLHSNFAQAQPLGKLWDVIVPIPGSPETQRARGFHHTALLAERLGRMVAVPTQEILFSSGKRKPQVRLSPGDRQKNAENCFKALPGGILGKRILLVDDVTTTGYTAEAAALALLKEGALEVDIVTLARSPHFTNLRQALRKRTAVG